MSNIQVFNNPIFGRIRTVLSANNEPLFCLTDICKALDIKNVSDCKSRLNPSGVGTTEIGVVTGKRANGTDAIQNIAMNFITEPNLYKCIFQSRRPDAEKFQDWVCDDVIPSIRKTGGYIATKESDTPEVIMARAILIAQKTIEENNKKLKEATEKIANLQETNQYKCGIIEGLTEDIPLADIRQRINQIVRKAGISNARKNWHFLYDEFDKKYHINVTSRMNNSAYKGTKLEYIETSLNALPQLYDLACKLFESSYEQIMEDWGKTVRHARIN